MCLQCGYYDGRQVMDLEGEKSKREARIKAKHERIKVEKSSAAPVGGETSEEVTKENTNKEAREENTQNKKPKRRDDE